MTTASDELPAGWAHAKLGDFGTWTSGGTPSKQNSEFFGGDIPWVKTGDLPDGPVTNVPETLSEAGLANSSAKRFPPGTLLVAMYGATIGKLGVLTGASATNQACAALLPSAGNERVLPYLFKYLLFSRERIKALGQGGAQPNISQGILKELQVPVAPLPEQTRIVSKIDELFSRIDEGERALERVSMLVERYRQSVLKAAVTGELTRAWREKNKDALESSEALLARILAARREAWEKAELSRLKAKGIIPANDKWKERYKEPSPPDTADLPELPQGWTWVSVDQVVVDTLIGLDCGAPAQSADPTGRFPYVKMNNITMDGRVNLDGLVYISASEEERRRFSVSDGDILFNTRNSKELVGKAGLVVDAPACAVYNNNIMRLRTVRLADPRYVVTQMCEPTFRSRLELVKKATTSVAAVYAKDLFPLALALPPREEQEQIMYEVNRSVEAAHRIQQELSARIRAASALRQSVLREAFRGGLVSQHTSDEPASTLLERIAAERATDNTAPMRGRSKKTTA